MTYQAWGTGCPNGYSFWEYYGYSPGGLVTKKRLHVNSQSAVTGRDLDVTYGYNDEGQMTSVKYPSADVNNAGVWSVTPGVQYTYTFDAMGRPTKLTDDDATRPVDWAKDVTYNVAGRITQMRYLATKGATTAFDAYYLETKSFNNPFQLTRLTTVAESTSTTIMDMEYRFSATQNNGALTQQKDWVNGEELTFAYDSLRRVISAVTTGPEWGVSFTFDGFGNKTASTVTKGTAPASSLAINGANNRITTSGFGYDANGNLTAIPGQNGLSYDVSNRLVTASGDQYSYGPGSQRIWKKYPNATEEFYFYGAGGEKLVTYSPVISGSQVYMTAPKPNLYFAGKRIRVQDAAVAVDAGGSVRSGGLRYFPFGEEQSATTQDKDKFGTYYRDSSTGLDYAGHRFYSSQLGRFVTPDPYGGSASAGTPQSWNRYAYGLGDPVNRSDATGLYSLWIWTSNRADGVANGGSLVEFPDPVGESAAEKFERLEATPSVFPQSGSTAIAIASFLDPNAKPEGGNSSEGNCVPDGAGGGPSQGGPVGGGGGGSSGHGSGGNQPATPDKCTIDPVAVKNAAAAWTAAYVPPPDIEVLQGAVPNPRMLAAWVLYTGTNILGQQYVGITNKLARRYVEQLADKSIKRSEIPGIGKLTWDAARGVEQVLIENYGLGSLMNKINSIGLSNPKYAELVNSGKELVAKACGK